MDTEQTKNIDRETNAYRLGQIAYKCIQTGDIVKWLASLVKWLLIIIAAAIAFYCVCPKYYYPSEPFKYYTFRPNRFPLIRANRITGKIEKYINGQWTTQGDVFDQVQNRWQEVPIVQQGR